MTQRADELTNAISTESFFHPHHQLFHVSDRQFFGRDERLWYTTGLPSRCNNRHTCEAYWCTKSTMRLVKSRDVGTVWQYGAVLSISCFTGDSATATVSLVDLLTDTSSVPLCSSSSCVNQSFTTHESLHISLSFTAVVDILNISSSSKSSTSRRSSNASAGSCQSS